MLKPGGMLLFANFSDEVSVGYMETFMNWSLLLRPESEMWKNIERGERYRQVRRGGLIRGQSQRRLCVVETAVDGPSVAGGPDIHSPRPGSLWMSSGKGRVKCTNAGSRQVSVRFRTVPSIG